MPAAVPTAGAATVNVGELKKSGEQSGVVPIEFRSSGDVAALQMDVLFNTAAYTAGAATPGTMGNTFRVDSHLVEPGRLRVVVGAAANTAFTDSVVFHVPLTATGGFTSYFPVALANITLSSPQSAAVAARVAPGVRFTQLADGASLNGKKGIVISSDALAASGNITKVTYYAGDAELFSSGTAPFTYTWKPAAGGTYQMRAVATDSAGGTTTKTIQINVFLNSPPVTTPGTYVVTQNQKAAFPFSTLLSQASDPDRNPLVISEFDDHSASGGVLDISGNTITYMPKANFAGKDSFTFAVSDQMDGQADALVNLLVTRPLQTDLNADKQADIVLVSQNKKSTSVLTLGNGVLKKNVAGPTLPAGFVLAAVDDFNKDNKPDFLTVHPSSNKTQFILLDGTKKKSTKAGPTITAGFAVAAADDFNVDGTADLLLYNAKTRKTAIWYLNNQAKSSAKNGPTLPAGWQIAGTDDFNNDGRPDLCLTNTAKTKVVVWYMNNQVVTAKSSQISVSAGFQMAGLADFSSDAKPDLLLYNTKTRKTAIWRMNDMKILKKTDGPLIPSGYAITAPK
ncbi:hypothetical protein GCM10023212_15420 [Luteolibacter yonseiensis]